MAADLTPQPGATLAPERPDPRKQVRLGDQLIADGLLRPEQLQKALEEQRRTVFVFTKQFPSDAQLVLHLLAVLAAGELRAQVNQAVAAPDVSACGDALEVAAATFRSA